MNMNSNTTSVDTAKKESASTRASLRSVLVAIDLTPVSDRVLGRLARLPLARDARVTLLHVAPGSLHAEEERGALREARRALMRETRHVARSLPKTVRVEPVVASGAAAREIAKHARALQADMILMGRGPGRALRDVFLGSTAERVMRLSKLPVLVVRLAPRSAYSRPALALDLDRAAHEVVALMFRVVQPPRPYVQVIHAFDAPYQGLVYPSVSDHLVEERKHQLQLRASHDLSNLLATALAEANVPREDVPLWKHQVRFGSPRTVIRNAVQQADADLLVLGTHAYTGVAHAFFGSVAGDVLRDVTSDVLVVPAPS